MSCPLNGDFEVCEVRDGYTYVVPHKKIVKRRTQGIQESERFTNKDSASDRQTFESSSVQKAGPSWKEVRKQTSSDSQVHGKASSHMTKGKKTAAGAYLLLIMRLKNMQKQGVNYAAMNTYFRSELGVDSSNMSMGMSYLANLLTYDPRHDPIKTYQEVFAALARAPNSIDWLQVWDVIDGIPE